MKTDLFTTKKEQLMEWMKAKELFATHQVIEWGTTHYYNRAAQTKGDLRIAGIIKKLDDGEKAFRGFKCKDEVYQWVGGLYGTEKNVA